MFLPPPPHLLFRNATVLNGEEAYDEAQRCRRKRHSKLILSYNRPRLCIVLYNVQVTPNSDIWPTFLYHLVSV
jgi:hypothetical protein